MQLSYVVSSLSAMVAVSYAAPSSLVARGSDFIGAGQIIMEHDTDGTRLGCLTNDGFLAVNTSLCGSFTGAYESGSTVSLLLTTRAGGCGFYSIEDQVQFTCGDNALEGGSVFSVSL